MKQTFIPFICLLAICLCSCATRNSRLPDGWYHINNTLEDSIVKPAILTINQIAAVTLDSFQSYDGMIYQINARIIQKKKNDFADATEHAIGRQIAFIYKGEIINAPLVNSRIEGGRFAVTFPERKKAVELYYSIIGRITPEPDYTEAVAPRDSTQLYFDDYVRFDSLLNAWTTIYGTAPRMRLSSNTGDARKLEQYPHLLRMNKKILPLLVPHLAHPDNFFMLVLYDDLQDDDRLKSTDYKKGEQFRAKESVRKYVEDRLQLQKRIFKNNKEKLAAMKQLMEIDSVFTNPFHSPQQMDSILLNSDYEIMEAIRNDKWFDEIKE